MVAFLGLSRVLSLDEVVAVVYLKSVFLCIRSRLRLVE